MTSVRSRWLPALLLCTCTLPPFQPKGKRCDGPAACPEPLVCARGLDGDATCEETSGPTVDLDFLALRRAPRLLEVGRRTPATVVDANGRVADVTCDGGCLARLDFDAAPCADAGTAGCAAPLGLLVEPDRMNLIPRSASLMGFSNLPAGSGYLDAGAGPAPDGALDATAVTDATTPPTPPAYFIDAVPLDDNTEYVASLFVKKKQGSDPCGTSVGVWAPPAGSRGVTVNAATGAVRGFSSPGAFGVTDVGDWWRVWANANSGTGNYEVRLLVLPDNDSTCQRSTTTVWGAQLERGRRPTSWVRSGSGGTTREADEVSLRVGPWLDAARGTLYAEIELPFASVAGALPIVTLSDESGANAHALSRQYVVRIDGGTVAELGRGVSAPRDGQVRRVAFAWERGRQALYVDDVAAGSSTADVLPEGLTRLSLGTDPRAPSEILFGHVRRVVYWPSALDDASLERLSRAGPPRALGALLGRLELLAGASVELGELVFGGAPPYGFSRESGPGEVGADGRFTAAGSGRTQVKVTDADGAWVGIEVVTP